MNIPGLENMDPASREQAKLSYAITEIEKLQKEIEGLKGEINKDAAFIDIDDRLAILEDARQVQIRLNVKNANDILELQNNKSAPRKSGLAVLLNLFRKKK